MRVFRLARVAADAERIRLERLAKRIAVRAVLAAIAAAFGLAGLLAAQVTIGFALARIVAPVWAALIVFGIDMFFALIFLGLASRSPADPVAEEAREVRNRALGQMRDTAALATLVAPVSRVIGKRNAFGVAVATVIARILAARNRPRPM